MEKLRRYGSIFLLTVFLAAYLTSSLHKHPQVIEEETVCVQCLLHHHSSHISEYDGGFSECVLCHFLGLPFLVALVSAIIPFARLVRSILSYLRRPFVPTRLRINSSRAPPVMYSL